jgi:hypothetical protein
MAIIQNRAPAMALPRLSRRVLYIGPAADEVCAIVTQHVGEIDIRYESDVRAALVVARQSRFDTVIVDQRDESLATRLIVPLISGIGYDIKLVVVSGLKDVSQYLTVPGVARVLTAPIREGQLLRVLGLNSKPKHFNDAPKSHRPVTAKRQGFVAGLVHGFFSQLMAVVSALYKRAPLCCCWTLFVALRSTRC